MSENQLKINEFPFLQDGFLFVATSGTSWRRRRNSWASLRSVASASQSSERSASRGNEARQRKRFQQMLKEDINIYITLISDVIEVYSVNSI